MSESALEQRAPYLTIVAASRNDDHGGCLLRRMQLFVSGLLEQCRRYQLSAELVLVEWNPPVDRPRLADALSWSAGTGSCSVRIIEVLPEIRRRFKYAELHLYSMFIDGLLCHAARHSGVQEVFLRGPMRIYHIEHGVGSGWTPEGQEELGERLRRAGEPQLEYSQYLSWTGQMRRERRPLIFNADDWGLAGEHLPETKPVVGGKAASSESADRFGK